MSNAAARPAAATRSLRCAVYTRKSSEEGLDQAFNSLDAQREAGLDFIRSQKHQGWVAIDTSFDDGGFSGGSLERPALQQLLSEIDAGRVDVVVVYKVDRLSRSLADFARLMQLFDDKRVSFVSVTQQFNTTTSMGRLTLNMLLSFAQFEREVAGERVRDKIAATMRKGVWVCGQPPLGYRQAREGEDRRLRIVEHEAEIIRLLFSEYLRSGSLLGVATRLNEAGHTTRLWTSSRGVTHGGNTFTPTHIYRMLCNQTYIGKITHSRRVPGARAGEAAEVTLVHEGLHEPIIDQATWDAVHAKMVRVEREAGMRWTHTHLLQGKLRTFEGYAVSPGSVPRPIKRNGLDTGERRRVFYYTSQKALKQGYSTCPIRQLSSGPLDELVRALVLDHLHIAHGLRPPMDDAPLRDRFVRDAIERVVLAPDTITINLADDRIESMREELELCGDSNGAAAPACVYRPEVKTENGSTTLLLRVQIKRLVGRRMLVAPDGHDLLGRASSGRGKATPRRNLVHAIALAYAWRRELASSRMAIEQIAEREGVAKARVYTLLPLTQLGPEPLRAILTGEHSKSMTLKDVLAAAEQLDWEKQAKMLRLPNGRV